MCYKTSTWMASNLRSSVKSVGETERVRPTECPPAPLAPDSGVTRAAAAAWAGAIPHSPWLCNLWQPPAAKLCRCRIIFNPDNWLLLYFTEKGSKTQCIHFTLCVTVLLQSYNYNLSWAPQELWKSLCLSVW